MREIAFLIAAFVAGVGVMHYVSTANKTKAKLEQSQSELDTLKDERVKIEEIARSTEEIQRQYNETKTRINSIAVANANSQRLRNEEAERIIQSATIISDAAGRYAEAAERDIARLEYDATRLAIEAAESSSTAHAIRDHLDQLRKVNRQ
jgi:hypothetical protein